MHRISEVMDTRIHMDIGPQLNDRTVDHIVLVYAIDATEKVGDPTYNINYSDTI